MQRTLRQCTQLVLLLHGSARTRTPSGYIDMGEMYALRECRRFASIITRRRGRSKSARGTETETVSAQQGGDKKDNNNNNNNNKLKETMKRKQQHGQQLSQSSSSARPVMMSSRRVMKAGAQSNKLRENTTTDININSSNSNKTSSTTNIAAAATTTTTASMMASSVSAAEQTARTAQDTTDVARNNNNDNNNNNNNNNDNNNHGSTKINVDAEEVPAAPARSESSNLAAAEIGSLLDIESPLNLRLATFMQQPGKAFRAIAVTFPTKQVVNFEIVFEDIASGTKLRCRLDEVQSVYMPWVRQFRVSWVVLFVGTLSTANAVLLENAVLYGAPGRETVERKTSAVSAGGGKEIEEPDHVFMSYCKLREILCKKKRDEHINTKALTHAVLQAPPDAWKSFIHSPSACSPAEILTSSFNFQPQPGQPSLNKQLLHAQLVAAAITLQRPSKRENVSSRVLGSSSNNNNNNSGSSVTHIARRKESWMLIFVSAPLMNVAGAKSVVPLMQDLLTGEFVEPLLLGEKNVIYIIGSGTAAESFSQFPIERKGRQKISILLQDIENQLGTRRIHRPTITTILTQALDLFSRYTWLGLMQMEDGSLRVPRKAGDFTLLHRRSVTCEILPGFLEAKFGNNHNNNNSNSSSSGYLDGNNNSHHHHNMNGHNNNRGGGEMGSTKINRRLEEHIKNIFNNNERFLREKEWNMKLRSYKCFFMELKSANITAARRVDNPFSTQNGIIEFHSQLWPSLNNSNNNKYTSSRPPPIESLTAKYTSNGGIKNFIEPEDCLPDSLFVNTSSHSKEKEQNNSSLSETILIAWDIKRVLLFLRTSKKLQEFLYNGGKIWCIQYAQYLLKGFNHNNLTNMERTLLHYYQQYDENNNDSGGGGGKTENDNNNNSNSGSKKKKEKLHHVEKLRIIFEKQLDIAVNTRQLISILHRMDGLLSSAEMELRGLQISSQEEVNKFSLQMKTTHEKLEKCIHDKIMEFTLGMDKEVRKRINFRSPQDISTIIYGGALCRHLSTRYIPTETAKTPVTALFPHSVCKVTGTAVPKVYTQPENIIPFKKRGYHNNNNNNNNKEKGGDNEEDNDKMQVTEKNVKSTLKLIEKYTSRSSLENLMHCTCVIVITCKVRPGSNFLESFCLHCPSTDPNSELKYNIAVDDIIPLVEDPEMITIMQLKEKIMNYKPLRALQPLKKYGKKSYDLRNILILTQCLHDKLASLLDTGIIQVIAELILGIHCMEEIPLERVCFCDLQRAFPSSPSSYQGVDSFENDFLGLIDVAEHAGLSAKNNWEVLSKDFIAEGGFENALKNIIYNCAALVGTSRDPFRNTHPLPISLSSSSYQHGLYGQEQASIRGLLWMITPEKLHPLLYRSLKGKNASSNADIIERITVVLSSHQSIDVSFFKTLQQLRFTEKKMQLFEEGALFRAVLPECKDRVHGELCHSVTSTGRLSSQSPNLQNIPKEEDLRRLIISRFGRKEGRMIEADYSQLEVVVLAALSRDTRMLQELHEKVDFHCLRVSLMTKEPYEEIIRKTKVEKDLHYIQLRQQAKTFSFQRQYGAGISTIASTTGLTEQEVERLISAEEQHYKELNRYYRLVMDCVGAGADKLLRLRTLDAATWSPEMKRMILLTEPLHYFVVPTGSKFDFTKDKKSIPRLKNYPVQGLAGEIVQIMCGKIVRRFYEKRNYNGKAFLVNTVHDCVWIDAHVSVADEIMRDVSEIMSSASDVISGLWPDIKLDVPFNADVHIGPSLGELSR